MTIERNTETRSLSFCRITKMKGSVLYVCSSLPSAQLLITDFLQSEVAGCVKII